MAINYIKPFSDKNYYLMSNNVVSVHISENDDDEFPEAKYWAEITTVNDMVCRVYLNNDDDLKAFKMRISHAQII